MVVVYMLTFPNRKKYIGVTRDIHKRILVEHPTRRGNQAVGSAIRKYGMGRVTIRILATVDTYEEAFRIEEGSIVTHKTVAPNGYNLTSGGEGVVNRSPEMRAEQGRRISAAYWADPARQERHRAALERSKPKRSAAMKDHWQGEYGDAMRESRQSTDFKEKISEAGKRRMKNPEERRKISEKMKALWSDPEYRARMKAAHATPEFKAKMAERNQRLFSDPEWYDKWRAGFDEGMKSRRRPGSSRSQPSSQQSLPLSTTSRSKKITASSAKD